MSPIETAGIETRRELRWRKKGGRLIHAAIGERSKDDEGWFLLLYCEPQFVLYREDAHHAHLNLQRPDDAEVTCRDCARILDLTPAPGGGG